MPRNSDISKWGGYKLAFCLGSVIDRDDISMHESIEGNSIKIFGKKRPKIFYIG